VGGGKARGGSVSEHLFTGLPEPRKRGTSIAGTHSGRAITHDWITPKFIIDALGGAESFDLDPCQSRYYGANASGQVIVPSRHFTLRPEGEMS